MNQPLAYIWLPTFLNHNAGQKTTYFFVTKIKKFKGMQGFAELRSGWNSMQGKISLSSLPDSLKL